MNKYYAINNANYYKFGVSRCYRKQLFFKIPEMYGYPVFKWWPICMLIPHQLSNEGCTSHYLVAWLHMKEKACYSCNIRRMVTKQLCSSIKWKLHRGYTGMDGNAAFPTHAISFWIYIKTYYARADLCFAVCVVQVYESCEGCKRVFHVLFARVTLIKSPNTGLAIHCIDARCLPCTVLAICYYVNGNWPYGFQYWSAHRLNRLNMITFSNHIWSVQEQWVLNYISWAPCEILWSRKLVDGVPMLSDLQPNMCSK